jgi:hypothetical protein
VPTLRITTRYRRRSRTPAAAGSPRTGPVVQTQSASPRVATLKPPADATWQAIVEQLLASPPDHEPYEAPAETEAAWARRLGMHINRPPKRR